VYHGSQIDRSADLVSTHREFEQVRQGMKLIVQARVLGSLAQELEQGSQMFGRAKLCMLWCL
jgi:hypothetical protein